MHCPFCQAEKDALKVIDSRSCDAGRSIRRRRECLHCHRRFTTYERVEDPVRLTVVKKDGRRVPWDREKLLAGLQRATFKRPIPEARLSELADEVEEECRQYDREVPTEFIGQQVADRLRRLDSVAYVRFASVYRAFKTVDELIEEAQAIVEAAKMEDPGQGRLFLEQQRAAKVDLAAPETNGKPRKTRAKPAAID